MIFSDARQIRDYYGVSEDECDRAQSVTKRWNICIAADWSSGFRSRRLPQTERREEGVLNDVAISTSWKRLRSIERERETARFLLTDKWRKAFATNYGTDTSSCGPSRPIFAFHRSGGLSGSSCYYCRPLSAGDPLFNRFIFSRHIE